MLLFIETCNCASLLFVNWYLKKPYILKNSTTGELGGFLTPIVLDMVQQICGSCAGYDEVDFTFTESRDGRDPEKRNEYELKRDISKDVDISFPVYSREGIKFLDRSVFLLMIQSGISFIVRDTYDPSSELTAMILGVMNVWPLLLICYLIAAVSGIVIWVVVSLHSFEQLNRIVRIKVIPGAGGKNYTN